GVTRGTLQITRHRMSPAEKAPRRDPDVLAILEDLIRRLLSIVQVDRSCEMGQGPGEVAQIELVAAARHMGANADHGVVLSIGHLKELDSELLGGAEVG